MKSSCIQHPANEPLVVIRKSQVEFCGGNSCAAALMSFFEYWHNIKLDMQPKNKQLNKIAEEHGDEGKHDSSLYQFHSMTELEQGIMGVYGISSIKTARKALVSLGVISEHANPNKRYAFDKTIYYLFHPEIYQKWLQDSFVKNNHSIVKNNQRVDENNQRSVKTGYSITETTTETTTETLKESVSYANTKENPQAAFHAHQQAADSSRPQKIETSGLVSQTDDIFDCEWFAGSADAEASSKDHAPNSSHEPLASQEAAQAAKKAPKNTAKTDKKASSRRFVPPTYAEVAAYCLERNNGLNANHFVDYYESKGWMIGKNKMKNWKAAVRTWEAKSEGANNSIAIAKPERKLSNRELFNLHNSNPVYLDMVRQDLETEMVIGF